MLAPALEHGLELLVLIDAREHLDTASALGRRAEAHEVELTRVLDPGGAMEGALLLLAPPQPDVELARVDATLIGGVEARERGIARGVWRAAPGNFPSHQAYTRLSRWRLSEKPPAPA